jgi:type II secretory pathway predicted ATPase ExeA
MVVSRGLPVILTPAQEAALGRIRFALEEPAGIVLLCGPAGVGTSLVLARVAADLGAGQPGGMPIRTPPELADAIRQDEPIGPIALVDDAHLATADMLAVLASFAASRGGSVRCVVLAGRGRLLTLVGRDSRIAPRVRLRAIVPPLSLADTRRIVESRLGELGSEVVQTCHEITAGIPAALERLVELATVSAGRRLTSADIETIHRRLDPQAV